MLSRTDKKMPKGKDGTRPPRSDRTPYTNLTCGSWSPSLKKNVTLVDYYVRELGTGLRRDRLPQGLDKGSLTLAVEYVLDHLSDPQCLTLKLSGLAEFVEAKGLSQPSYPPASIDPHPDVAARARQLAFLKSVTKNL